jgi:hypothetical protein
MIRKGIACVLLALAAGCGSTYYKVTTPSTGKTYYTTGYQDLGYGQGIQFNDLQSGARVTLPAYEIKPIKKEELPADAQPK